MRSAITPCCRNQLACSRSVGNCHNCAPRNNSDGDATGSAQRFGSDDDGGKDENGQLNLLAIARLSAVPAHNKRIHPPCFSHENHAVTARNPKNAIAKSVVA